MVDFAEHVYLPANGPRFSAPVPRSDREAKSSRRRHKVRGRRSKGNHRDTENTEVFSVPFVSLW
jgi:hypothetical protein